MGKIITQGELFVYEEELREAIERGESKVQHYAHTDEGIVSIGKVSKEDISEVWEQVRMTVAYNRITTVEGWEEFKEVATREQLIEIIELASQGREIADVVEDMIGAQNE